MSYFSCLAGNRKSFFELLSKPLSKVLFCLSVLTGEKKTTAGSAFRTCFQENALKSCLQIYGIKGTFGPLFI